jgi:hypothetical protein
MATFYKPSNNIIIIIIIIINHLIILLSVNNSSNFINLNIPFINSTSEYKSKN